MACLYKKKFFLALYDINDNFMDEFSNPCELADKFGISAQKIYEALWRVEKGQKFITLFNKRTKIFLIEADKEEKENVRN